MKCGQLQSTFGKSMDGSVQWPPFPCLLYFDESELDMYFVNGPLKEMFIVSIFV